MRTLAAAAEILVVLLLAVAEAATRPGDASKDTQISQGVAPMDDPKDRFTVDDIDSTARQTTLTPTNTVRATDDAAGGYSKVNSDSTSSATDVVDRENCNSSGWCGHLVNKTASDATTKSSLTAVATEPANHPYKSFTTDVHINGLNRLRSAWLGANHNVRNARQSSANGDEADILFSNSAMGAVIDFLRILLSNPFTISRFVSIDNDDDYSVGATAVANVVSKLLRSNYEFNDNDDCSDNSFSEPQTERISSDTFDTALNGDDSRSGENTGGRLNNIFNQLFRLDTNIDSQPSGERSPTFPVRASSDLMRLLFSSSGERLFNSDRRRGTMESNMLNPNSDDIDKAFSVIFGSRAPLAGIDRSTSFDEGSLGDSFDSFLRSEINVAGSMSRENNYGVDGSQDNAVSSACDSSELSAPCNPIYSSCRTDKALDNTPGIGRGDLAVEQQLPLLEKELETSQTRCKR